jgi:hypothetical protein
MTGTSCWTDDARQAVAGGAAFLDIKRPGWAARIDADTLRVRSMRDCVIGQLYGGYFRGLLRLRLSPFRAHRYGFDTGIHPGFALDRAWSELIRKRQQDAPKDS